MKSALFISFLLASICQCLGVDLTVSCDESGDMTVNVTNGEPKGMLYVDKDQSNPTCRSNILLTIPVAACNRALSSDGDVLKVTYLKDKNEYTVDDEHFLLSCIKKPQKVTRTPTLIIGVTKNVANPVAVNGPGVSKIGVVSLRFENNGGQVTPGVGVKVGDMVSLIVELTSDTIHKIIPWKCEASYLTSSVEIVQDRCPFRKGGSLDFQTPIEVSHKFAAFGMGAWNDTAGQILQFACIVQVCGKNDTNQDCNLNTDCSRITPTGRRRRAAADDRGTVTVTSQLRVYDPSKKSIKEASNTLSTSAVATIGSSAGAVFILLSTFFIVLAVRIRRRKQKQADEFSVSQVTEVSQTPVGDRFVTEKGRDQEVGVVNSAYENTP